MTNTINCFHQLALANRSLIDKVLNKEFYGFRAYLTPDNLCDLQEEGYIALYKAASRYQEGRGTTFATYAYTCVRNALLDYIRDTILLTYEKQESQESDDDMDMLSEPESPYSNVFFTSINDMIEDEVQYVYSADYLYDSIDRKIAINALGTTERDIFTNKTGVGITDYPLDTKQLADKYGYTTQHVNRLYRAAEQKVLDIIQSA
jgi:RNA polymerase sigma factor (sigma-70 family)